eukprot:GHVN01078409.1.p2 GENE.GHVN01078409.1~~GHVN01078409.1.p2  ORF type:complete len:110 (+),score=11.29 GHVN01078409.1:173-502(+)
MLSSPIPNALRFVGMLIISSYVQQPFGLHISNLSNHSFLEETHGGRRGAHRASRETLFYEAAGTTESDFRKNKYRKVGKALWGADYGGVKSLADRKSIVKTLEKHFNKS